MWNTFQSIIFQEFSIILDDFCGLWRFFHLSGTHTLTLWPGLQVPFSQRKWFTSYTQQLRIIAELFGCEWQSWEIKTNNNEARYCSLCICITVMVCTTECTVDHFMAGEYLCKCSGLLLIWLFQMSAFPAGMAVCQMLSRQDRVLVMNFVAIW